MKKVIIKRIIGEDKTKGPRRNLKLPEKHLFHSRPEVLRTTFRRNKISKRRYCYCHRTSSSHFLSRYSFFFLPGKKPRFLLFIVSQTCFNKNDFLLLLNHGFSLFFELLDNLATHITLPSEEDPDKIVSTIPSVDRSNPTGAQKDLLKQTVGSDCGNHEHNSHIKSVTCSHTTMDSVTSIVPHLVPFKPGSTLSKFHGPTTPSWASCMNRASVFELHKRFKEGRESVRYDERCGRSNEVNIPELIVERVRVRVIILRF